MRARLTKQGHGSSQRNAFTLVEMLVSVTLVLLMMGLFASIFQIATDSMTKQRGISEQDQRARILATNVRKDLQHRTFRYLYPFFPNEDPLTSPTSFANRNGYFYISTNSPDTGLDDVIQFTVSSNITTEDPDSTPIFGRAMQLIDRSTAGASLTSLHINPNQPEADDGSFAPNSGASSPYAEVCYFVRNGNLYRRVVLIREPLNVAGQNLVAQPTSRSGYNYLSGQPDRTDATTYDGLFKVTSGNFIPDGPDGSLSNDFQLLFDHSAFASFSGSNQSTAVLGVEALSNATKDPAARILANPARRWGFNPLTSRSREHSRVANATSPSVFIGRYTHAETSSLNFNFPQNSCRVKTIPPSPSTADSSTLLGNGNPLDVVNTPVTLNSYGVVSEFDSALTATAEGRGGIRRVEDLLLANVHEMKVELWDQRLQRFVVPGHFSSNLGTGELGDFHFNRCLNPKAVPIDSMNNGAVFDTWHSQSAAYDSDGDGSLEFAELHPPYMPYNFYPPAVVGTTGPHGQFWQPSAPADTYAVGSIVLPEWKDVAPLGVFSYNEISEPSMFQIGLKCIAVNDADADGVENGPAIRFPAAAGQRVTDGEVTWESFDNRRPLQSIRLTFRFHDKPSDNMRQLSLVIPVTDVKK